MKIAFINIYQENTERGGEVFVSELSKRLSKNHKVEIIKGNLSSQDRWPILSKLFIDPNGLQILFFTLSKIPYLLQEKFDVVIPLNGGWMSLLLRIVTWLQGKKMFIVGQSGIGWDDRINLYSLPDFFIPISSRAEKWAKKLMPKLKIKYIPNGVDRDLFKPTGTKYNHGLKKPVVLCVAALVTSKKIEKTIKAVSLIPEASLLIVGKGELEEKLTNLCKELLPDRFKITNVSHQLMPSIYRSADCFTLMSDSSEAFGIVYAEALATNLPVVAPNDEQRKEIIGDAGIISEDNEEQYVKSIKTALAKKFGNKPREQSEKFDWDIIAEQYEELLTK